MGWLLSLMAGLGNLVLRAYGGLLRLTGLWCRLAGVTRRGYTRGFK